MKNYSLRLIIFVTVLVAFSVSCSKINSPSLFLNDFSLSETIKRMNVQGVGASTGAMSSTASAGDPSPHRRDFDLRIVIDDSIADTFDEEGFLAQLQDRITQEANGSDVKVSGAGTGDNSFHINYHSGKHFGGIEVIGVRTDKNNYRMWCIIRELAANG